MPTLAAALLAPLAASADVGPALEQAGWRELVFRGRETNRFEARAQGIEVVSRQSVSVLWRDVEAAPSSTPLLRWRWRVEEAVPPTDLSRKGGDDRSLAVYVAFAFDAASAGFWERAKRAALGAFTDDPLPGQVLTYVWGGEGPEGWFANPHLPGGGMLRVLRGSGAPLGRWLEEEVDLEADFRAAFGAEPGAVMGLGISADSDDTGSHARGRVAGLVFEPR
ncbi:DUF3047 domain-containing protein [Geminicoccaceae bacterium 1502E]|nr:DUF3047 domain-containing protein [Geminicoccaceae bacterium 1502E]